MIQKRPVSISQLYPELKFSVMELVTITQEDFPLWLSMRQEIYPALDREFHVREMNLILTRADWFPYFVRNEKNLPIGLVELSARNIADGCLSSPVAYLEGLFLVQECRGQGNGRNLMHMILSWCRERGYQELATDAEYTNTSAQKFYTSLGFEEMEHCVQFRIDLGQSQ